MTAKGINSDPKQGLVFSFVHGGRIGALLEMNCETDFVARNEQFVALGERIVRHIVGAAPIVVHPEDIPMDVRERERHLHAGSDDAVNRALALLA